MKYNKLPVSALELRVSRGDIFAREELELRANSGMRRATLALERLGISDPPCKPTAKPIAKPAPSNNGPCTHKYYEFECPCCVKQYNASWAEVIQDEA